MLDRNGDPVVGAAITAWVRPTEDFGTRLAPIATDDDGRFEYSQVPTGCLYGLQAEARGISYAEVGGDLDLKPGETKDLDDVTVGGELNTDQKSAEQTQNARKPAGSSGNTVSSVRGRDENDGAAVESGQASVVTLRGRVLDPEGKPLAGAGLYLSYPTRTRLEPQLLGTSGAEGRFEFQVDTSKLDRSYMADPWTSARLTAAAEGFGVEWTEAAKAAATGDFTLSHRRRSWPATGWFAATKKGRSRFVYNRAARSSAALWTKRASPS